MKKTSFLILSVLLALLVTSISPAVSTTGLAAGPAAPALAKTPITLTITNPLPKATTVNLTGAKPYTINVPQGATITKTLEPGKYKYTYLGCLNKAKKGNLKTKGATAALKITPCKMATWSFFNADDTHYSTLRLNGWVDYSITVGPGQFIRVSWVADTYKVTHNWCGKTNNFTWKVKGKKNWIIKPCN
jgi:hypothetical protein